MKCPIDNVDLVMADRNGVEIDYCPKCRGVWLDRGELDKIIERAVPPVALAEPEPKSQPAREYRQERRSEQPKEWREPYREHDRGERYYKKKRRKSFLEEIFDFD
jgi:Zn-finger nucleic acid-binding protein